MLCVALVCVMGTVEAAHSHPENSTTSQHACSICAAAHIGLNTQTITSAPVSATAAMAIAVSELSPLFRPAITQFVRPPPTL